jgi:pimeloyl-ACP methyl ester carboxylesterase
MTLAEELLVTRPGVLSRRVRLASGVTAHYATSGEVGPAVVLLHGGIAGSSGLAGWGHMAASLGAAGFRVYAPDMPGFGLTDDPAGFYSAGQVGHLDFLHDFTTALCLDRFALAGNSMGCQNAVNYLLSHPERVERFALVAGSVGDIVPVELVKARETRPAGERPSTRAFDGTAESMRRMMAAIVRRPDELSEDLIAMRTAAANRNREAYERHNAVTLDATTRARLSTAGRLDKVEIPGIYLYGLQDVLISAEARGHLQEDALPRVQFFYPDDCGHQGQTDQPELFADVFREFFRDGRISFETAIRAGISTRRPPHPELVATRKDGHAPL